MERGQLDPALTENIVASLVLPLLRHEAAKELLSARGSTNVEIGKERRLSAKTFESFKARGMKKLGLNSRAEIVRYAMQYDWLKEN